jgi:hypothetical protein
MDGWGQRPGNHFAGAKDKTGWGRFGIGGVHTRLYALQHYGSGYFRGTMASASQAPIKASFTWTAREFLFCQNACMRHGPLRRASARKTIVAGSLTVVFGAGMREDERCCCHQFS